MTLSMQDRARISQAIRQAEARTSGEIVCVLARVSADSYAPSIILATVLALALPWVLLFTTQFTVVRLLEAQILCFVLALVLFSWTPIRIALIPRAMRRAVAHRVAMQQFVLRGIARKADRCGVLIFVSLAEHYARIIADEGVAAKVSHADWQAAVDALITGVSQDRIADGFIAAIELCGDRLAAHFPPTAARSDDLPDRIYLI